MGTKAKGPWPHLAGRLTCGQAEGCYTGNPVSKTTPDATIRKEVYLTLDLQQVLGGILEEGCKGKS